MTDHGGRRDSPVQDLTPRHVFELMRRHFSPAAALAAKFAGRDRVERSAMGCEVILSDGRSVLDFGSYAVSLLGHRNPAVVAAVRDQLDRMPVSTRTLANPAQAAAAECLAAYVPARLDHVHFGLNGADAVEVAVKLARVATGRTTVLAAEGGFHGKSMGALALTHAPRLRDPVASLLGGVRHVRRDDRHAVRRHAADGDLAAVVFEPIQGENGVTALEPDVLRAWIDDAHSAGAFAIADEIQVGLRRAGEPSLSAAWQLPVDGLLLGKPLGGGVVPVSALVCNERLYDPLRVDPFLHSATFSANPLAMVAVPVALAEIERHADNAVRVARSIGDGLRRLHGDNPDVVTAVRGQGLIWSLEVATPALAGEVHLELVRRDLVVSPCLSRPEVIRLLPPMVAGPDEVDRAMTALAEALSAARGRWPADDGSRPR